MAEEEKAISKKTKKVTSNLVKIQYTKSSVHFGETKEIPKSLAYKLQKEGKVKIIS